MEFYYFSFGAIRMKLVYPTYFSSNVLIDGRITKLQIILDYEVYFVVHEYCDIPKNVIDKFLQVSRNHKMSYFERHIKDIYPSNTIYPPSYGRLVR
jgi:hypothetical protein